MRVFSCDLCWLDKVEKLEPDESREGDRGVKKRERYIRITLLISCIDD